MAAFTRIIQIITQFGQRAINWVYANRDQILNWINAGQAIDWIVRKVKDALGIK
ncbi:aureocin A53 family class IId bacteriocin [Curtobacterium sp. RRHDQ10]|uniref:aureocin A53 family class IId bacteriocin n=1 Tax=Curtobacterium phyllosphaerae TaxID=3413379 RepID=UPI003BF071EA